MQHRPECHHHQHTKPKRLDPRRSAIRAHRDTRTRSEVIYIPVPLLPSVLLLLLRCGCPGGVPLAGSGRGWSWGRGESMSSTPHHTAPPAAQWGRRRRRRCAACYTTWLCSSSCQPPPGPAAPLFFFSLQGGQCLKCKEMAARLKPGSPRGPALAAAHLCMCAGGAVGGSLSLPLGRTLNEGRVKLR